MTLYFVGPPLIHDLRDLTGKCDDLCQIKMACILFRKAILRRKWGKCYFCISSFSPLQAGVFVLSGACLEVPKHTYITLHFIRPVFWLFLAYSGVINFWNMYHSSTIQ